MYKKLNNLGFIIGIFFIIISMILLIGGLISATLAYALNFYTGFSFLIFGIMMVLFSGNNEKDEE